MLNRILPILFILNFVFIFTAYAEYDVNENCKKAWQEILDLKLITAKATIAEEIRNNPKNYYAYFLDQTCDVYAVNINPSEKAYEELIDKFENRIRIMDDKDTESPYYLACKAEMYLQMSILNVIFGDKVTGIRRGFKAYRTLYDNVKRFPDFVTNKKLDGFFNVTISNLPGFVQWSANVFGVNGTAEKGFNLLYEYFDDVNEAEGLNVESALFIMLMYKMNKEPLKAYEFIRKQDTSIIDYGLIYYFYANTAYRSAHNDEAYEIFQNFDPDKSEIPFVSYDYMMGKIHLRRLDDSAAYHFERFLELSKDESYKKEINYKLAIYYLINGNKIKFEEYRQYANEEGDDIQERDREAQYDSELDFIPDINLTKARLLFEGGDYERGTTYLDAFKYDDDTFLPYKLQYLFLKGMKEEHEGHSRKAIRSYKQVIETGEDEYYHFACEAALHIGLIYMQTDRMKAEEYFEKARDLYDSDYYQYLDDIAKRELKIIDNDN